jgi:hypothetical protein
LISARLCLDTNLGEDLGVPPSHFVDKTSTISPVASLGLTYGF